MNITDCVFELEKSKQRIAELEAERDDLIKSISVPGKYILWEDVQKIEAERDRLQAEVEFQKSIERQMQVINKGLRARLERLVTAAERGWIKLRAYRGICKGDT